MDKLEHVIFIYLSFIVSSFNTLTIDSDINFILIRLVKWLLKFEYIIKYISKVYVNYQICLFIIHIRVYS